MSLPELVVAVIVLTISILTVFAVFASNQVRLIKTVRGQQLSQVVRNEAERMMSLDYVDVVDNTTNPVVDGQAYTVNVTIAIVQLTANPQPVAKEVTVTGFLNAEPANTESIIVVKAP